MDSSRHLDTKKKKLFYGRSLKLVDKFAYFGRSISSTENDVNTWLAKVWTAIGRLSVIWKSDLSDKIKSGFFQTAVVHVLLYGCITWTLTKRMPRKIDGNCTRMQQAVLNNSWRLHPTKQQLYSHQPPISKTTQTSHARHAGHCWWSKGDFITDILQWTPSHSRTTS